MVDLERLRQNMIDAHLKVRGIHNDLVLGAMAKVRREDFIPEKWRDMAYDDRPLPIAEGQTISQPFMVAFMTQALGLKGGEKVLEIGTGSGYAAAILGEIAGEVFTIERHKPLAVAAKKVLKPYENIHVIHGDGTKGHKSQAPFDAIVATAAGPRAPAALKSQLKVAGRLVIPIGENPFYQRLVKITRSNQDDFFEDDIGGVAFVPLIGEEGF